MAETPLALWVFLFFLMFPLMGFVTLWYRATCVFFAIRDCTYQAAKEQSFTTAKTKAQEVLKRDSEVWTGIKILGAAPPECWVVTVNPSSKKETEQNTNLASVTFGNIYMLRTRCQVELQPIINMGYGGSVFANIPGLTGPMPLNFSYQVYVENAQGLTQ